MAAIVRRATAAGDFATILRKGDPDRGALLLFVTSRGQPTAMLERILGVDGVYRWERRESPESPGSASLSTFLDKRARFDEDFWAVELDIAEPERFIAETTLEG